MKRIKNAYMNLITFLLLISFLVYNLITSNNNKVFLGIGILFCLMGVMLNVFLITSVKSKRK